MIVLGIDPGLSGGLAIVSGMPGERARLLDAIDVPTSGEKAKRRVVAAKVIAFIMKHKPDYAFIERAQAMPDQGASSGFIYGRAVGALEACAEGCQVSLDVIESTAWKKAHGLIKTGKEDSRARALRLFSADADRFFDRKKDHNRAEAALIALYGLMLQRSVAPVAATPLEKLAAGE